MPSVSKTGNRISNGIEARKHSHPWQALVITHERGAIKKCGGSLIHWKEGNSSDLILTAAHCVIDDHQKNGPLAKPSDVHVYLGAHDVDQLDYSSERIGVKEIFAGEFNKVSSVEDLAILRLEKEIAYGKFIQGICLPAENEKEPEKGSSCVVTGWGLLGGPLACLRNNSFVLYGIVSFSFVEDCSRSVNKHAFMKIPYYLKWLYNAEICGQPYYKPYLPTSRHLSSRIANGVEARKHSHPWQALIHRQFDDHIGVCGGSLIHWKESNASDLILTAAHCVLNGHVKVYLGVHNTEQFDSNVKHFLVSAMGVGSFSENDKKHDIAVLKLENKATYNEFIQGVCLPTQDENLPDAPRYCMVAGWGLLDTVENRIANGIEAKRHSHPWQALIYKKTPEVLKFCGGSLIDWQEQNASDLVLTAAHCVTDGRESTLITNVSDVEVYLGMHIAIRVNSNDKRFRVAAMVVGEFNKITRPHDIAVLKLDRMATYSKFVQGVCLPMEDESLPTFSKHCVVGDSGGPLTCMKNGTYFIYGIMSFQFPEHCTDRMDKQAFVKVSHYIKWLNKLVCKLFQQFCGQPVFKPILSKQDRAGNRISNGIEARKHSHPWQALILIMNPEGPTICGGSLMHWKHENAYEGYPLVNISNVVVRLGVHDLKQSTSATKELRATAMAVAELDISNKTDDIALLKLEKEVTYNAEIQGICLPAENEVLPPESLCLLCISELFFLRAFIDSSCVLQAFCGQPFFKPIFSREDQAGNRISNGIEARAHSHPWQALIVIQQFHVLGLCGGSLIHWKNENASDVILTAAHCFNFPECKNQTEIAKQNDSLTNLNMALLCRRESLPYAKPDHVIIYLGLHDLKRPTSVLQRLRAKAWAPANFDVPTKTDDIALIKLEKEVTYNAAIQGVCLPAENEDLPPPESTCLVAGWGRLLDGRRGTTLQQFQTYLINGTVNNPFFQKELMICTGSEAKNTGARQEFCGQPFFKPIFSTEDQIENRISNGIEARIHSHPWQALVIVSESGSVVSCGGSLINWKNGNAYEGVPLVSASDVIVYLGLHDLTQLSSVTKRLEVVAMAAGDFEVSTASGDIGLLKLEKEVTYNAAIQGVCLPTENEGLPRPESPCLALCGKPFFKPVFSTEGQARNRISNGIEAKRHSHPWLALLIIKDPESFAVCGGSLIHWKSENASAFVLTAAHCLIDSTKRTDDIALIKLDREVAYNVVIQGVCLPSANEALPPPDIPCLGDSGGPLVCLKNNTFFIYGVVSFGFRETIKKEHFTTCTDHKPLIMKSDMQNLLVSTVCSMFLLFNYSEETICGKPFFKPILSTKERARNRISNGLEAKVHSHPWQAFIHLKHPTIFKFCGGSLIHYKQENSSDLILTAAHCLIDCLILEENRSLLIFFFQLWCLLLRLTFLVLRDRYHEERTAWQKVKNFFSRLFKSYDGAPLVDAKSVTVFLGVHDYKRPSRAMRKLPAAAVVAGDFDYEDATEDIALIKLGKEVAYTLVIQGVCLPAEKEALPPPESPCLVTGWGRLRTGKFGTKLQQFQTHIIDGKVSNPFFQEKLMICTGSKKKNTGARKGDSGGPLVCLRNNTFVIYGVLSFGFKESCSDLKDRQAFTKVTRYLSWLKEAAKKLHT
ncbi:Trypsin domain containing protein [Trichuris trichiura]|uniref:Trypsin domain containing protein n=1 Tax=Trichuris trichiura TaxID=36087 RepID=A0A077Z5V7_TRITR|nr:Trypsin domain containing protein [Trichuris trichiura]